MSQSPYRGEWNLHSSVSDKMLESAEEVSPSTYGNGYKFIFRSMVLLGRRIKAFPLEKRDLVLAATGDEGEGKTSLSFNGSAVTRPDFTKEDLKSADRLKSIIDDNMIINPYAKDIISKVNNLEKSSPIILDEAVKSVNKYLWNTREQIGLTQFFSTCRKQYKFVFMCIPDLFDMAPFYRNRRVRWWLRVLGRNKESGVGIAALFVRKPLTAGQDPWSQDQMQKILESFYQRTDVGDWDELTEKVELIQKFPNFYQLVNFCPIPEEVEKYYEETVEAQKAEISDVLPRERGTKTALVASKLIQMKLTEGRKITELAKELGVSQAFLSELAKKETLLDKTGQ
jgi:hypothetical protein